MPPAHIRRPLVELPSFSSVISSLFGHHKCHTEVKYQTWNETREDGQGQNANANQSGIYVKILGYAAAYAKQFLFAGRSCQFLFHNNIVLIVLIFRCKDNAFVPNNVFFDNVVNRDADEYRAGCSPSGRCCGPYPQLPSCPSGHWCRHI